MGDKTTFQTLKPFPMQNLTETPPLLKKTKFIEKNKKKAIETLSKKSRAKLKRKAPEI